MASGDGHAGSWIVEVDIQQFFDTLDHAQLRKFLQHRVRDGVLLRLIGKWLKAGVMEDGSVRFPDAGTPQGGVISPLLSNIYLHYVLDEWFECEIQPRLYGSAGLTRFADDVLLAFTREDDAATCDGGLAEALCQIRPESTPGQDPDGALSASAA